MNRAREEGLGGHLHAVLRDEQLGVQDGRAGRAADRVVAHDDELQAEHRVLPDPADRRGHAALGVAVEQRLWTVRLVADDDRMLRCRWKPKLLPPALAATEARPHP